MAKEICVLQERDDIGEIYLTFIAFKISLVLPHTRLYDDTHLSKDSAVKSN